MLTKDEIADLRKPFRADQVKLIPLYTKGQIVGQAQCSESDFEKLMRYKWHPASNGYAIRRVSEGRRGENVVKVIWMHRQIMDAPKDMMVDHINGNKLDNRRENLRLATRSDNVANQKAGKTRGIYHRPHLPKRPWNVVVTKNGYRFSKFCVNREDAVNWRDTAALALQGDFAVLANPISHYFPW